MWNVTQSEQYQIALKRELEKSWRLVTNRLSVFSDFCYQRTQFIPDGIQVNDLMSYWMDKRSGLKELRDYIEIMMISDKPAEKKFGEELLTLYIHRVSAEMSGKPECFLDSIIRREKLRQFSAESFRDADYDFLNTLFACFPEVIFNTPGIMQQHWLNKALLPENLGKTALALVAGYQSFAVLRSHSLFDEAADVPVVDRFNNGFKEAFGMHPSRFAMQLPQLDKESAKYLLRYIKKSPARQTSDYNIVGSVRFGFSGRCLAIKAMGLSGFFNSAKFVNDITRYAGPDEQERILSAYVNHGLAPIDRLGKLFRHSAVSTSIINRFLHDETPEDIARFQCFINGFSEEDRANIQIRTQFPAKYLTSQASKRMVLTQDLGL